MKRSLKPGYGRMFKAAQEAFLGFRAVGYSYSQFRAIRYSYSIDCTGLLLTDMGLWRDRRKLHSFLLPFCLDDFTGIVSDQIDSVSLGPEGVGWEDLRWIISCYMGGLREALEALG